MTTIGTAFSRAHDHPLDPHPSSPSLPPRSCSQVGKYRKVTLPQAEIDAGITPGTELPVWDTRFGKLGIMICCEAHTALRLGMMICCEAHAAL